MNELKSYVVKDWVPQSDGLCVVFLLESPYGGEVLHKHPLAGASGKNVTEWLVKTIKKEFGEWDPDIPFGCHLRTRSYGKIGLMNCSQLPMDKSVYTCSSRPGDIEKIIGMDVIRRNPDSASRKIPAHALIERQIIKDLASRLTKLPDNVLIVPCGIVARTLVSRTQTTLTIYQGEVPHPSRKQWSGQGNQTAMNNLAVVLRNLVGRARLQQP